MNSIINRDLETPENDSPDYIENDNTDETPNDYIN